MSTVCLISDFSFLYDTSIGPNPCFLCELKYQIRPHGYRKWWKTNIWNHKTLIQNVCSNVAYSLSQIRIGSKYHAIINLWSVQQPRTIIRRSLNLIWYYLFSLNSLRKMVLKISCNVLFSTINNLVAEWNVTRCISSSICKSQNLLLVVSESLGLVPGQKPESDGFPADFGPLSKYLPFIAQSIINILIKRNLNIQ